MGNGRIANEHHLKSLGFCSQIQAMYSRNFDLIFKAKLNVRVRKPKNPIWPPGNHFESDIAENPVNVSN